MKLCVGIKLILTDNIYVSDTLINGSIGTVKPLDRRSKPLCSTIYVKIDDSKTSRSLKDRRLRGEMNECVPITAKVKRFPLKKGKSTAIAERKQCLLIHGHAIPVHKPQGSTLTYM